MALVIEPTADQQAAMWDDVRDEFPGDELMQEIHFVRLLQHFRTQAMTATELMQYYNDRGDKTAGTAPSAARPSSNPDF